MLPPDMQSEIISRVLKVSSFVKFIKMTVEIAFKFFA